MRKPHMILPFFIPLCFSFCQAQVEDNVTGTFTFNEQITELSFVYAWYAPDMLDSSVTNIHLVFSDDPIPNETHSLPDLRALGEEGMIHGLMVVYSTEGDSKDSVVEVNLFHEETGHRSLGSNGGEIEVVLTKHDEMVMEGKFFTKDPTTLFDYTYELDVSFKVSLPNK